MKELLLQLSNQIEEFLKTAIEINRSNTEAIKMPLNNDSQRLDGIEKLIEESNRITLSNSRFIQAMLEARATERLEHEERMRRWEETIRSLAALDRSTANVQQGLANIFANIDEDRPTISGKLNTLKDSGHGGKKEGQSIQSGSALKRSIGNLNINFPTYFSNIPIVFVSSYWKNRELHVAYVETIVSVNNSGFVVTSDNAASDYYVNWIAVGNLQHPTHSLSSGFPQAASVNSVTYPDGVFVKSGSGWVENNVKGTYQFEETGRDQWSIYLRATDRNNVNIQLDLWTEQVKYNGSFLYKIIDAQ